MSKFFPSQIFSDLIFQPVTEKWLSFQVSRGKKTKFFTTFYISIVPYYLVEFLLKTFWGILVVIGRLELRFPKNKREFSIKKKYITAFQRCIYVSKDVAIIQ